MTHPGVIIVMIGLAVFLPVTKPALTFEQRWEPVKQLPPMIDKSPRELTFEERWEPVRRLPQMLNYEREELVPRIIPVRTIAIRPEPAIYIEPPAVPVPRSAPQLHERPKAVAMRKAELDICRRHGMVKQVTNGGKSWRCRK